MGRDDEQAVVDPMASKPGAPFLVVELFRLGFLEEIAAFARDECGEAGEILEGMKLCLVGETNARALHQGHGIEIGGVEAELIGELRVLVKFLAGRFSRR